MFRNINTQSCRVLYLTYEDLLIIPSLIFIRQSCIVLRRRSYDFTRPCETNLSDIKYPALIQIISRIACMIIGLCCKTYSRLAPSQWETSLQNNPVSHWLGANTESDLCWRWWGDICLVYILIRLIRIDIIITNTVQLIVRRYQCLFCNPSHWRLGATQLIKS